MITSIDTENRLDNNQHSFMEKNIQQTRNKRELLQSEKDICKNAQLISLSLFNSERLGAFLLRSGTQRAGLLLPLLLNIIQEVLARVIT